MQPSPVLVLQHTSNLACFLSDELLRHLVFRQPCRSGSPQAADDSAKSTEEHLAWAV
jgi:hypothetical protein